MGQTSVVRAVSVVTLGVLADVVVSPYFVVGPFSPKFTVMSIVYAVCTLRELQAILTGFFGGILLDALGGGPFGVGAMGGLIAALLSVRGGAVRRKESQRFFMAQIVGISVAVYDLVYTTATGLAGLAAPPFVTYVFTGALPDAALNALLAYAAGRILLNVGGAGRRHWEGER